MQIVEIKDNIEKILDNNKAQSITSINLKNKSYIADYMIIASGTSSRHLQSLSEILVMELKKIGIDNCRIEGKDSSDWNFLHFGSHFCFNKIGPGPMCGTGTATGYYHSIYISIYIYISI